jgi:hypothetical protein
MEDMTHTDTMTSAAVGGEHLGKGYYRSLRFIGTLWGISLSICTAYAAWVMPAGILTYINNDIG